MSWGKPGQGFPRKILFVSQSCQKLFVREAFKHFLTKKPSRRQFPQLLQKGFPRQTGVWGKKKICLTWNAYMTKMKRFNAYIFLVLHIFGCNVDIIKSGP